ncbi:hypothetical protein [Nostoc sp.]|uniref:hypothetical protein n=1 Tax=Nostoc sp. TaxID=1180 RepID=UPI002FFADA70
MNEIFLLARETVRVIFHMNGGYTRVVWERSENTVWAGIGWIFDIPTYVIPSDLRGIGSRFLLLDFRLKSRKGLRETELKTSKAKKLKNQKSSSFFGGFT